MYYKRALLSCTYPIRQNNAWNIITTNPNTGDIVVRVGNELHVLTSSLGHRRTVTLQVTNVTSLRGVSIDKLGYIYIVDSNNHKILVWDQKGQYIRSIGSHGCDAGQLNSPQNIAIDHNSNIYVTDEFHYRIQIFSTRGSFVEEFGRYGACENAFWCIRYRDIAVSLDGTVAASDNHGNIHIFSACGEHMRTMTKSQPNSFKDVTSLTFDHDSNLLVTDPDQHSVFVLRPSCRVLATFGSRDLYNPSNIAVTNTGKVVVVDNSNVHMFVVPSVPE